MQPAMEMFGQIMGYLAWAMGWALALAAVFGAVQVATTRDDAFDVAGRKPKWVWFGILLGCGFALIIKISFLGWVAAVVLGIYWFDVRPQIKDILAGTGGL